MISVFSTLSVFKVLLLLLLLLGLLPAPTLAPPVPLSRDPDLLPRLEMRSGRRWKPLVRHGTATSPADNHATFTNIAVSGGCRRLPHGAIVRP